MSESVFEKKLEISMLYDFYGQLLTDRQKSVMDMYCDDDFSLAEIAEQLKISRQAVHDSVKNAEKSLHSYEEKLKLISRFSQTEDSIRRAVRELDDIIADSGQDASLTERLYRIRSIIDKMED